MEVALNLVERTDGVAIRCRGTNYLAAPNTLQSQAAYQSRNGTTGNSHLVTSELLPDLHDAVALHVVLPYTLDVLTQQIILLGASASPLRLSSTCCMQVVTGRSDLHHAADRLDPVTVTVLVNEGVQGLLRRSSSAWAK